MTTNTGQVLEAAEATAQQAQLRPTSTGEEPPVASSTVEEAKARLTTVLEQEINNCTADGFPGLAEKFSNLLTSVSSITDPSQIASAWTTLKEYAQKEVQAIACRARVEAAAAAEAAAQEAGGHGGVPHGHGGHGAPKYHPYPIKSEIVVAEETADTDLADAKKYIVQEGKAVGKEGDKIAHGLGGDIKDAKGLLEEITSGGETVMEGVDKLVPSAVTAGNVLKDVTTLVEFVH